MYIPQMCIHLLSGQEIDRCCRFAGISWATGIRMKNWAYQCDQHKEDIISWRGHPILRCRFPDCRFADELNVYWVTRGILSFMQVKGAWSATVCHLGHLLHFGAQVCRAQEVVSCFAIWFPLSGGALADWYRYSAQLRHFVSDVWDTRGLAPQKSPFQ